MSAICTALASVCSTTEQPTSSWGTCSNVFSRPRRDARVARAPRPERQVHRPVVAQCAADGRHTDRDPAQSQNISAYIAHTWPLAFRFGWRSLGPRNGSSARSARRYCGSSALASARRQRSRKTRQRHARPRSRARRGRFDERVSAGPGDKGSATPRLATGTPRLGADASVACHAASASRPRLFPLHAFPADLVRLSAHDGGGTARH